MEIRSLTPTAFRNLSESRFEFHPGLNLIVGRNGQGKTNVIESVAVVSGRPSFRTSELSDLLRDGTPEASVSCSVRRSPGEAEGVLSVALQGASRSHFWDGRRITRLSAARLVPAVFLTDEDLHRIDGPPAARRRALDRTAHALEPSHAANLARYERARAAKSQVLAAPHRVDPDQLAVYREDLALSGAAVVVNRRRAARELAKELATQARLLRSPFDDLLLRHRTDLPGDGGAAELAARFLDLQQEMEPAERQAKRSLVGPHRDDLELLSGETPVARHASSGQRRTLVLAWTLAERALLERESGVTPILAFDDFDSEWDREVLSLFAQVLPEEGQVFLTSARPEAVRDLPLPAGAIFRVDGGRLAEEGSLPGRRLPRLVSLG